MHPSPIYWPRHDLPRIGSPSIPGLRTGQALSSLKLEALASLAYFLGKPCPLSKGRPLHPCPTIWPSHALSQIGSSCIPGQLTGQAMSSLKGEALASLSFYLAKPCPLSNWKPLHPWSTNWPSHVLSQIGSPCIPHQFTGQDMLSLELEALASLAY